MRIALRLLVLAVAAVIALAHATRSDDQGDTSAPRPVPVASTTSAPPALPPPAAASQLTAPAAGASGPPDLAPPAPSVALSREAGAAGAAASFMRAFARPTPEISAQVWWAGVEPLLSPRAARDYAGTNPTAIAFTTPTGNPQLLATAAPPELLTAMTVATDAGTYRVELEHSEAGWRVTRLIPPPATP